MRLSEKQQKEGGPALNNNVIEGVALTQKFGGVTAVNNFSFEVKKNTIVSIIGPNGAGKTTVFNIITGVYNPTAGKVLYYGSGDSSEKLDITGHRPDRIAKLGIARTFQNIRLFPGQTVLENVLLGQHLNVKSSLFGAVLNYPYYYKEEREMRERAMHLLEQIGIANLANSDAVSLPYGIQRKLEIIRALSASPKLLLLDEPAAGMNPQETNELATFIQSIRTTYDVSILLIEHHMDLVMEIAEDIYVLDFGKLIAHGTPDEVQNNPAVITAYLGVEEE